MSTQMHIPTPSEPFVVVDNRHATTSWKLGAIGTGFAIAMHTSPMYTYNNWPNSAVGIFFGLAALVYAAMAACSKPASDGRVVAAGAVLGVLAFVGTLSGIEFMEAML